MEGELIIITIISTIGGLGGLMLINHNWFKRQETKYTYELKRARLNQKFKAARIAPEKETTLKDSLIGSVIKNLDPDQIAALADRFLPGGDEGGEIAPEGLDGLIEFAAKNPEIVKSFLGGVSGGKKGPGEGSSQV